MTALSADLGTYHAHAALGAARDRSLVPGAHALHRGLARLFLEADELRDKRVLPVAVQAGKAWVIDAIKSLDLDLAAIFQTNALATTDLNKWSERAANWAGNKDRFEEWARLAKADREARANGPARIASALASGGLDPKNALLEIETAFAEACWKTAISGEQVDYFVEAGFQMIAMCRGAAVAGQSRGRARC
jgi:hypothetical protein